MSRQKHEAAFYQAHKDDAELWGEPKEPAPAKRRQGLAATITVRFSAEEAELIRRLARDTNLTYSDIVRKAVQSFTQPRFTVQDGVVYRPLAPSKDAGRAADDVIMTTLDSRVTVTSTSSEPPPVRR